MRTIDGFVGCFTLVFHALIRPTGVREAFVIFSSGTRHIQQEAAIFFKDEGLCLK